MKNVIEAYGIQKQFGGVIALRDAEIACPPGKICGLLGANGSGKTTFSKILCGILPPDAGTILLNGQAVTFKNPREAQKARIAMVHQHLSLIPDLTVWQNINLGRERQKWGGFLDNDKARGRAEEILAGLYPGLHLEARIVNLSPGQQQLVEIAKAISMEPQLLILDEPTASLEADQVKRLFTLLKKLKEEKGTAIIYISHRLHEVKTICDYVVVLRNGKKVGEIELAADSQDIEQEIVSLITGNKVQRINTARTRACSQDAILVAENLAGPKITNVSLSLRKGEILGIGGLQDQGQEQLLLALAGYLPLRSGSMFIRQKKIHLTHPAQAIGEGIVIIPGDRQREGLFLEHPVIMNLIFPRLNHEKPWLVPWQRYRQDAARIIDQLQINTPDLEVPVKNLSGGNQQKVVVGKWLNTNLQVLLLNDPTKGVDVGAKQELFNIITRLADQGTGVILYSSDNEELTTYCERVLIMYEGRIIRELNKQQLGEEELVAASLNGNLKNRQLNATPEDNIHAANE